MDKRNALISGTIRRNAFVALTREQRLKYEIARELNLLSKVRQVGWAGLSAQETGRIGGLVGRRKHAPKEGE